MEFKGFRLERGEISILTFNQPRVNVFSTEVLKDFIRAIKTLKTKKEAKVVVITGEGNSFMAGADIKEMAGFNPKEAKGFSKLFHEAMALVENFPRPTLAVVNGFALGGGSELTLVCDIVIASESAVFGQPEINLGVIPGAGATIRLKKRIGEAKAKEIIFTGERVSSSDALNMGLINKVIPAEKLMEEAMSLAKLIAKKPVQCLESSKALINSGSLNKEIDAFSKMFSYSDRKRLMTGFLKRR